VYCATKFAVRAIADGLRQETDAIRVTVICPGVVESELTDSISDDTARAAMLDFRRVEIAPDAIARSVAYAIEPPADVDAGEIVVRPNRRPFLFFRFLRSILHDCSCCFRPAVRTRRCRRHG
jgi:NADP-dependent 3-hydroxy acid dehydrogenase YdfG